jgi:hypothetical protein
MGNWLHEGSSNYNFLILCITSYKIVSTFTCSEPQTSHKGLCTQNSQSSPFCGSKMLSMKSSQTVFLSAHILHNQFSTVTSIKATLFKTNSSPRLYVHILQFVSIHLKSKQCCWKLIRKVISNPPHDMLLLWPTATNYQSHHWRMTLHFREYVCHHHQG